MLMNFDLMQYLGPTGPETFEAAVENADRAMLKRIISFNKAWTYIYGHQVVTNIEEVKNAYKKTTIK